MAGFDLNSYVDVQTRITRFWQDHPDGAIRTVLASDPNDFKTCRYRAEVFINRDNPAPDATGYAFEIAGSGMANKTSHEENCETSAIGRALANLGYATSQKDRPSRQEMGKAQRGAQAPQKAPDAPKPANTTPDKGKVMARLHALANDAGLTHDDLRALVLAKVDGIDSMNDAPVDVLVDLGKRLANDPAPLKQWLAKQQELLPGEDVIPTPRNADDFTR